MKSRRLHCWLMGTLMGAASAFAPLAWSTEQGVLPSPTGRYAVGRTYFDWVDDSRADPGGPDGHREFVVWVWYPASPAAHAQHALWMPGKWADGFWSQLLSMLPNHPAATTKNPIANIRSNSYEDAPFAAMPRRAPVLVFAPGAGMVPLIYSDLIEDVASHGYVVAAIVPTYYSGFTVFSGGHIVTLDKGKPPLPTHNHATRTSPKQQAIPLPGGRTVYATPEEIAIDMKAMLEYPQTFMSVWTGDMRFTLNQLEKMNENSASRFAGRLDTSDVGAFGHSYGGAASVQLAKDDPRVRAAVDLAGSIFGSVANTGVSKPVLIFVPPVYDPKDVSHLVPVFRSGRPGYRLTLAGAQHYFSSDLGFMPFVPTNVKSRLIGSLSPSRALKITKAYVEAFFGEYVSGRKASLLQGPSAQYPEVTFAVSRDAGAKSLP